MMSCRYTIIFFLLLLTVFIAEAQTGTKRCRWVRVTNSPFLLDSLSVFPESVYLSAAGDTTLQIQYDLSTGKAMLSGNTAADSVLVCYDVMPFTLHQSRFKRDVSLYDSSGRFYKEDYGRSNLLPQHREEIFSSPGIQKTGTISRGISFGNNQNVFVNSVLNLQMEGRLTDDLTITAVISDQNIPFQPQGNTQQIQEFDKVYIQLKNRHVTLTAGDIVLKNDPSYFLRYYRNIQGGKAEYQRGKDSTHHYYASAGFGISKGKFNSMLLGYGGTDSLIEGVQGPYRLRGPNGERFITIIANSERVYLDGQLLERGFDYDYVIDYNTAEITFTNKVMITRYSRIRINFEFTDRNYSRNIYTGSFKEQTKNVDFYAQYYEERDNPNNSLTFDLNTTIIDTLIAAGDSLNSAIVSGATPVEYSANKILYETDTIGAEIIYVYSTDPDSAVWDVRFSQVPQGQGSYILSNSTVNGRIFTYVGFPNGNYVPYVVVPTPKQKRVIAGGAGYTVKDYGRISSEVAISRNDLNLFSEKDSDDDDGLSWRIGYHNVKGTPLKWLKGYRWLGGADYEYNSMFFTPIDRFRDNPDFERDWNEDINEKSDNHIVKVYAGLTKDARNNIVYTITRRKKGDDVDGYQQELSLAKNIKNFQVAGKGFLMENRQVNRNAHWQRYSINTFYNNHYLIPGVQYSVDKNVVRSSNDSVISTLMNYEEAKFYLKSSDSIRFRFAIDQNFRSDYEAYQGAMAPNSNAQTTNLQFGGKIGENHQLNGTATYRYIDNTVGPTPLPSEENVLSRADWNANLFRKHLRSELTIISGTGRSLKRQFAYQPVAPGQGNYVWNDFNENGIQELNEFVSKVYDDPNGEYIKIFLPMDEYIKSFQNNFNYRVDLSAPRGWREGKGKFKSLLSRFSNITSWTVNKNITDNNIFNRFVPFISNIDSMDIITYQSTIRTNLFFNRSNPTYGWDVGYASNENKQFVVQGFETIGTREVFANGRVNIRSIYNAKLKLSQLEQKNASDFLSDRNYYLITYEASPELAIQPKNTFRFTARFTYKNKENILPGGNGERADIFQSGVEVKMNKVSRRTITSGVKYIYIYAQLNGTSPASPVSYQLFEALQPGNNFTWLFTWQEKLVNGLQLSFNYEGRKSEKTGIVHIGRMQVSALF